MTPCSCTTTRDKNGTEWIHLCDTHRCQHDARHDDAAADRAAARAKLIAEESVRARA